MRLAFVLMLAIIFLVLSECVVVEGFENLPIYLVGDSILENTKYVRDNQSVAGHLRRNEATVINLARDGCRVAGLKEQIRHIPCEPAVVVVSAGGNNILQTMRFNRKDWRRSLDKDFSVYKDLVGGLLDCPKLKVVLMDVYYPVKTKYEKYHPQIAYWNAMLYKYSAQNEIRVRKISRSLTSSDDFKNGIEPSASGGAKIAEGILDAKG